MCKTCGFLELAFRVKRHLETTVRPGHQDLVLCAAAKMILENGHATADQVDAIEAVLEQRESAAS